MALNQHLHNTFDHDNEMWHSYDYARCLPAGRDVYYAATWEERGGVGDSGYIWTDDTRWSIDTPENPESILALMTWRQWYLRGPIDLRGAAVSVYLRGDGLDLKGGHLTFWVLSRALSTRLHFIGQPLPISAGHWDAAPVAFTLANDAAQWHRSWTVPGRDVPSLHDVLGAVDSYGFAFVGFREQVTGHFAIDEFEIGPVE